MEFTAIRVVDTYPLNSRMELDSVLGVVVLMFIQEDLEKLRKTERKSFNG